MHKTITAPLFLLGTILFFSCKNKPSHEETQSEVTLSGDTIAVVAGSSLASKIQTADVNLEQYRMKLVTVGTVKAIPTQYAEIAPPFQGRVTKSYLSLGMKTAPHTPLFEISSPDFIAAQKNYFQQKAELEQARRTLNRQKDLVAHGVGIQKELEEAQTAFNIDKTEYDNAIAGLRIFKANPEKLVFGQPLVVYAPIAGEVIDNKVVLGQFIKDDAASVATIADLSKVWIAGQVKEKDIRFIRKLEDCDINIAALPEKHIKGKIYHVQDIVDEETRSVQVLVEAQNADRTLKPGMYVNINFFDTPSPAILIPSKAILQANDGSFVYVEVAPNKYIRRKIQVGESKDDKVVVVSGINQGEKIIVDGGFYLQDAK